MPVIIPDRCEPGLSSTSGVDAIPARHSQLGSLTIRRALPRSARRMVGPWCFLDRYGPLTFQDVKPMDLGPHPHIGLQTVSWLLDGELLHRDSLGSECLLRPGGVNLMTAGIGIAHSEETPLVNTGHLNGVQLWIALPEGSRNCEASFEYRSATEMNELRGGRMTLLMGQAGDVISPATTYSPLIAADLEVWKGERTCVPLQSDFEHALLVTSGSAALEGRPLVPDVLYYIRPGKIELPLDSSDGARILLIGGAPFGETVLMWWNFVARTEEEIIDATEAWARGDRFGTVVGYQGPPIPAPPLEGRMRPPVAS